jgi:hypothetical protein
MRITGTITKGLLVALILTLVPITAFAAQKITPGSTCKVLKQKVVYLKKTYTCTKSGKKLVWSKGVAIKKPTPTPTPSPASNEKLIIAPVPFGSGNTTFMLGKPQSRDIGQTLYFDSPTDLTRLEFRVSILTLITPEYHSATEEQKHNLERSAFRGGYKPIEAKINVSLWRDDRNILGALPKTFDLRVGFTRMEEFDVTSEISVAETTSIKFPRSIQVTPGHYYLNLYFVIDDLNVTTLRFAGRQTGNNTLGGPNRDMPTNCKYTPASDLYPVGQAYYSYQDNGWEEKSPTEKWIYQTPRSYTFKLHDYAKVSECGVIGNYNDILNTGDIFFNVYGNSK